MTGYYLTMYVTGTHAPPLLRDGRRGGDLRRVSDGVQHRVGGVLRSAGLHRRHVHSGLRRTGRVGHLHSCSTGQGTCTAGCAAMAGLAGVAEVGATAAAATATGTAAAGGVGAATYVAYGLLSAGAYVAVPVAGAAYLYYRVRG